MLRYGLDPWTFRIAILVAAVRSGKLAIDVNHDVCFLRSRACFVRRQDSVRRGDDLASLVFGEESQRHLQVAGCGRIQPNRLTRERVEQAATYALRGNEKKITPLHASCSCFFR